MTPRQQTWDPLRHHGDAEAAAGLVDFAVNVHGCAPPDWLQRRLAARLPDLARYPSAAEERRARGVVAQRHGRDAEEVLLLAGAAEGFTLLAALEPARAAIIHPSFTEPEFALRQAGVPIERVVLTAPFDLRSARVPAEADLVVLGNPTNPTSVLHPRREIESLRRPGRIVVVDEAFADMVPEERESLAAYSAPDVLVLRSLTKTWALAGLRCGYMLGPPELLGQLAQYRPHWPLGTLQLEAVVACCQPAAVRESAAIAQQLAADRRYLTAALRELSNVGVTVAEPAAAPFLLLHIEQGTGVRQRLRERGIAVRRGDTFPGLSDHYVRVAVRDRAASDTLVSTLREVL